LVEAFWACWGDLLPRWEGEVRCGCGSERYVVEEEKKGEEREDQDFFAEVMPSRS